MRAHQRFITRTCSLALICAASVPAFAQSNRGPQPDNGSQTNTWSQLEAPAHLHARRIVGASVRPPIGVRMFRPIAAEMPRVSLPDNIVVPDVYRSLIEEMLERSPTFRRQALRLANAPNVRVRILTLRPGSRGTSRARTDIVRTDMGGFDATVQLHRSEALAELIAHEIEHIIEQMAGIDLHARALQPGTGVRWCEDGTFETLRAERVGALVAHEARRGR